MTATTRRRWSRSPTSAGSRTSRRCPGRAIGPPRRPTTPPRVATRLGDGAGQVEEYRAHLQRLQAEFDNYRKRVLREQTTAVEMAAEPVMHRLLEVLDDFELALLHATEDVDQDRLLKGVELVYAKLLDALGAEGLERIDAEGAAVRPRAARSADADRGGRR